MLLVLLYYLLQIGIQAKSILKIHKDRRKGKQEKLLSKL